MARSLAGWCETLQAPMHVSIGAPILTKAFGGDDPQRSGLGSPWLFSSIYSDTPRSCRAGQKISLVAICNSRLTSWHRSSWRACSRNIRERRERVCLVPVAGM